MGKFYEKVMVDSGKLKEEESVVVILRQIQKQLEYLEKKIDMLANQSIGKSAYKPWVRDHHEPSMEPHSEQLSCAPYHGPSRRPAERSLGKSGSGSGFKSSFRPGEKNDRERRKYGEKSFGQPGEGTFGKPKSFGKGKFFKKKKYK